MAYPQDGVRDPCAHTVREQIEYHRITDQAHRALKQYDGTFKNIFQKIYDTYAL